MATRLTVPLARLKGKVASARRRFNPLYRRGKNARRAFRLGKTAPDPIRSSAAMRRLDPPVVSPHASPGGGTTWLIPVRRLNANFRSITIGDRILDRRESPAW